MGKIRKENTPGKKKKKKILTLKYKGTKIPTSIRDRIMVIT